MLADAAGGPLYRVADHLSGVAHNFPEPGSWLNEKKRVAERVAQNDAE